MGILQKKMLQLAPPPTDPVGSGSVADWIEFEKSIGVALPADYKWLVDTYGAGDFLDLLVPLQPFVQSESINFRTQLVATSKKYLEFQEIFEDECPYAVFPKADGLIPVAQDTNGNDLFWIASESTEDWSLIHYNWRGGCLSQKYDMTLLSFIVRWIDGKLPKSFFGRGSNSAILRRNPTFSPLKK